jgi:hypothetical protein
MMMSKTTGEGKADQLRALVHLLSAHGIADDQWAILPESGAITSGAAVQLTYECKSLVDASLDAKVTWPMASGRGSVSIGLSAATRLVAMLLTQGWDRIALDIPFDAKPHDALSMLSRAPSTYFKTMIDDSPDQNFICAAESGFGHYYADTRPPVALIGWSERPAPVALHLAASLAEQKADIASKLAAYLPPDLGD